MIGGFAALESKCCMSENKFETRLKLGRHQGESGGVKDPEIPGGGVFQPFIEASGVPVLRVELVRAG